MAKEIERRFIVCNQQWLRLQYIRPGEAEDIVQGYIPTENGTTVRVRICTNISGPQNKKAYMTGKCAREVKMVNTKDEITPDRLGEASKRDEFETEVPVDFAQSLLDKMCFKYDKEGKKRPCILQ